MINTLGDKKVGLYYESTEELGTLIDGWFLGVMELLKK